MFAKVYCFLARVLSLHRANCQTISMYPVCFSKDFGNNIFFLLFFFGIFCFSIFFTFFCFLCVCVCVFLFETKKIYSDTYSTMQTRKWWRNFIWQISRNLATFFGLIWDFFLTVLKVCSIPSFMYWQRTKLLLQFFSSNFSNWVKKDS